MMPDLRKEVLPQVLNFSMKKFDESWDSRYAYHSWHHTMEVLSNTGFIGVKEGLNSDEVTIAEISALFHDLGHLSGYRNHEERSTLAAMDFLSDFGLLPEQLNAIANAIKATKVPQTPDNNISRVLCDADLMYLAGADFFIKAEQLREEWMATDRAHMDKEAFFRFSLDFLKTHHYHTSYGQRVLAEAKEQNFKILDELLKTGSINKHI
ncbi:MAG TPA: hypothetical protein DC042_14175 [Bacteroidales bacterium]|nr:hypothetical protein [Bacteroidales bacterium]